MVRLNGFANLSLPISVIITGTTTTTNTPIDIDTIYDFGNNQYSEKINELIIPIKNSSDFILEKKIEYISNLKQNWDGFGADTPSKSAIFNSLKFLTKVPEIVKSNLSKDDITPTPYGTIVFDFYNNLDTISIEIGDKQIGFFTDFHESSNISIESTFYNPENNLPIELLDALHKLYKRK
jgi:hypothetical protein